MGAAPVIVVSVALALVGPRDFEGPTAVASVEVEPVKRGAPPAVDRTDAACPTAGDLPFCRPPPPREPKRTGRGLFIAAGAVAAVSLATQLVGFGLARKQCSRPNPLLDPSDTTAGERFNDCVAAAPYIAVLRVASDFGLATSIGFAIGGSVLRGRRDAWLSNVVRRAPDRRRGAIAAIASGATLVVGASVLYAATRVWVMTRLLTCPTAGCVRSTMAANLGIREATYVLGGIGAGVLAWGISERVHSARYRDPSVTVSPSIAPTMLGAIATARF
jgi:hypothetical protein